MDNIKFWLQFGYVKKSFSVEGRIYHGGFKTWLDRHGSDWQNSH